MGAAAASSANERLAQLEAEMQELVESKRLVEGRLQDALASQSAAEAAANAASERVVTLEAEVQEHTAQAAQTQRQLEQQSQNALADESLLQQLQAECDKLRESLDATREQLEASQGAHGKVRDELGRATQAHASERQRADEINSKLGSIQSAHEALFTKYSATLEELDSLKGENSKASSMCNQLKTSLDEERRIRQEMEAAPPPGPSQLSVSDVLISVAFDGVSTPLQVRPWDTNFTDVVDVWLATTQRSTQLQPSIVRYLKHLEETAEVYPVRVDTKLHEVHAQFAI